jgi:hypothetical protein
MKKIRLSLLVLIAAISAGLQRITRGDNVALANEVAVRGGCSDTKLADAAIGRFTVVKFGSDEDHIDVCGVGDVPLGITRDNSAAAAEDRVSFDQFGLTEEEAEATASGAIAYNDFLVAGAAGTVRKLPVAGGTYYIIGRAKKTVADGKRAVFVPCFPIQRVVP